MDADRSPGIWKFGNDAIASGNEEDVIFGDAGHDFIVNQSEFGEIFGGTGNDFIFDGTFIGHIRGGAGDSAVVALPRVGQHLLKDGLPQLTNRG